MNKFIIPFALILFALSSCEEEKKELPIYEERVEEKMVEGKKVYEKVKLEIPDFLFYNQDSTPITAATFKDKIYITDFFFTSCPTICPMTKREMLRLYDVFEKDKEIVFLSHSIDTRYDSVAVLKRFADNLEVSSDRWHFVTGEKEEISRMARIYQIAAMEDKEAPGGYNHSGRFVLLDKKRRVRGYYDGTDPESVDELITDVRILQKE